MNTFAVSTSARVAGVDVAEGLAGLVLAHGDGANG